MALVAVNVAQLVAPVLAALARGETQIDRGTWDGILRGAGVPMSAAEFANEDALLGLFSDELKRAANAHAFAAGHRRPVYRYRFIVERVTCNAAHTDFGLDILISQRDM